MAVQRFKDKDGKWVAISGGGAGSGLQHIEERLLYLTRVEVDSFSEDYEISESERAYNIATLNLIAAGKSVLLVYEGFIIPSVGYASTDGVIVDVVFAMELDNAVMQIIIDNSGNAVASMYEVASGLLNTEQRTFYPTRTEVNFVEVGGDLEEEVISDDERAYNIETFNLAENGNVVIVDFGLILPLETMEIHSNSPEQDYARFSIMYNNQTLRIDIFRNGDTIASVTDNELLSNMEKNALRVWLPKSELTDEQRRDNIRVYNLIARNKGYVIAHAVTHLYSSPFEAYTTEPVYYTLFDNGAVVFSVDRYEKFTETINGVERQLSSVRTDFYQLAADGGIHDYSFNMQ